ncbi:MAG: dTDP-4-dehydrorhamnose 3,5-epimerase family protein [Bacteroidota bacterium]|nr:dTDP-4-dehydrorhamnose 3,5-epimerase family protein [Bacteroidota bacterium]
MFKDAPINGVAVKILSKYSDQRGWLIETFRNDELLTEFHPAMAYISMTNPQVARGPHEHIDQSDLFGFIGPSTFKIYLWDNRKDSPTYLNKMTVLAGEDEPKSILVPPGIVHAYKNIGDTLGMVTNYPNRLFMGNGKKEKVDEIRHEKDPNTIFKIED